jgi:DNA-binding MarR family transcriptional regulator
MLAGMPAKRSRDLTTTCGLLIEAASYLQRGMHDDVERATGLSGAWLEVLLRLHRTPGGAMRINEIAAQVTLPASSFSRLADRMEDEGLVERHPDPRHRRATLLHVTSAGEQRFAQAWKVLQPSQQARLGTLLSGDELDMLEKITRKIRDANRPLPVRIGRQPIQPRGGHTRQRPSAGDRRRVGGAQAGERTRPGRSVTANVLDPGLAKTAMVEHFEAPTSAQDSAPLGPVREVGRH